MTIFKPKREKIYGLPRGTPLDRNAKARITAYARAWSARNRQPGQHTGPITRAYMDVLRALLWGFHNAKSGACFPGYEAIAKRAECSRDTVREAIKALEAAGILSWVHRLRRLAGRVTRTSNGYSFRDPAPNAAPKISKAEIPGRTENQDFSIPKIVVLDPRDPLDAALIALGRGQGALAAAGA